MHEERQKGNISQREMTALLQRLRKKFGLAPDQNLIDFLISVK